MKRKTPTRYIRSKGWRIAERIIGNNLAPELDSLKLILSKTIFEQSLSKSNLIANIEKTVLHSNLTTQVVEAMACQHPADEWARSLPPKQSHDLQLAEGIVQGINDYITRHLPNAFYCASLLIVYQAIADAFGEPLPEPLMRELEENVLLLMRPKKLPTRIGSGTPEQWSKHVLEEVVDSALLKITTQSYVRLDKVAEKINELYSDELAKPFKANTLGRLLKRKKIDWLKLRAKRKKELRKRT